MPKGGFVIMWQLGASSVFLWRVYKGICECQRGGLFIIVYKASNRSITVYKSKGQLGASSLFP